MAAAPRMISESYDRESQRYFNHVKAELHQSSLVRSSLELFSELVGPGAETLDVGCGPGHIASFLASRGLHVSGIDISPALIQIARTSFPRINFSLGELAALPLDDSSTKAVVSRHSVIHTESDHLDAVFSEFSRVLAPDGLLFVSFFGVDHADEHGRPFDHAVCTAYQLDPDVVSQQLAHQGIEEEIRLIRRPRSDERQISHATLIARRTHGRPSR